jgi:hypothetical protein
MGTSRTRSTRSWELARAAGLILIRGLIARLAELAAAPTPRLAEMTDRELTLLGATAPVWDELWETYYMSHRPLVVDSSRIETAFGVTATHRPLPCVGARQFITSSMDTAGPSVRSLDVC